ncbi:MAG: hypothetical protein ACFFFO_06445 [Candidatus Thorarchaeota archaeon]
MNYIGGDRSLNVMEKSKNFSICGATEDHSVIFHSVSYYMNMEILDLISGEKTWLNKTGGV